MRYEVTGAQEIYFNQNKNLLLEDLFSLSLTAIIQTIPSGYDLWRTLPEVKKMACSNELGTILFQLTHIRPIRLLFDRMVEAELIDLRETSFQGAIAGVLVHEGATIIFAPDAPFAVEEKSLLLVYGELNSLFTYKENDPHAHILKKQGYTYGDVLKTDHYPLIYR